MRVTSTRPHNSSLGPFVQSVLDFTGKAFWISLVITAALFGYLLWGLLSGQLADSAAMHAAQRSHIVHVVQTLTTWLNVALLVAIISGIVIYYDNEALGVSFLVLAAFLAYGLQYVIDYLGASAAVNGAAAGMTLGEMHSMALMLGAPGILLVGRLFVIRLQEGFQGKGADALVYGKGAKQEATPRALIGALAHCWELPFCREGIRVRCPIYHARTKCWKERVGCMCEENIILLAMEGMAQDPTGKTTSGAGFVPVGDLLTRTEELTATRTHVPTRLGPRGVRIPTNPHLSAAQKRERCRNCVIYNEHERQKYQLLSVPATLIVPVLVYFQFDNLKTFVDQAMRSLDVLLAHVSINQSVKVGSALRHEAMGSISIESIVIVCLTIVGITWAHRLLEYCTFKIKI